MIFSLIRRRLSNLCDKMEKTIFSGEYARLLAWLKAGRQRRGLTMREAARLIAVPHTWIGKVEQGERRLDLVEYVRYCRALRLNPKAGVALIESLLPPRPPPTAPHRRTRQRH